MPSSILRSLTSRSLCLLLVCCFWVMFSYSCINDLQSKTHNLFCHSKPCIPERRNNPNYENVRRECCGVEKHKHFACLHALESLIWLCTSSKIRCRVMHLVFQACEKWMLMHWRSMRSCRFATTAEECGLALLGISSKHYFFLSRCGCCAWLRQLSAERLTSQWFSSDGIPL